MDVPLHCARTFEYYVVYDSPEEWRGTRHLADYAWVWLAYGGGARACANSYVIFLQALLLAEQAFRAEPRDFMKIDGPGAPPEVFFYRECMHCRDLMDPQFFQMLAVDPDWIKRRDDEVDAQDPEMKAERLARIAEERQQWLDSQNAAGSGGHPQPVA
jgi:hypothetical protein